MKIVLKADSADAILRFYHFIISYIENCHCSNELIISLLKKSFIFDPQLSEVTSTLLLKIIEFRKDPREQEKRSLRRENPEAWNTILEPIPPCDQWVYQEILEKVSTP